MENDEKKEGEDEGERVDDGAAGRTGEFGSCFAEGVRSDEDVEEEFPRQFGVQSGEGVQERNAEFGIGEQVQLPRLVLRK